MAGLETENGRQSRWKITSDEQSSNSDVEKKGLKMESKAV